MEFIKIDFDNYNRKEHYKLYQNESKNSFNMTVNIDITNLLKNIKAKNAKFYVTYLYMVSRAVNEIKELRMTLNDYNELGYWQSMSPSYTIFHDDTKTFSVLWSEYHKDYKTFVNGYLNDVETYKNNHALDPKPNAPKNLISISSFPWHTFTGMEINLVDTDFLLPLFTCSKYFELNNRIYLPLAIRGHHAVSDGYHASLFYDEFIKLCETSDEWL